MAEKGKSIKQEGRKGWYVIHTYAGYEDQVAAIKTRTAFKLNFCIFEKYEAANTMYKNFINSDG